mmetsp:Transcript_29696/g.68109  ORF Transcript_29696/g.68109 Transcript_29696/m.68109 type:complete len:445 (+) Transcript_29696:383-1717(+)
MYYNNSCILKHLAEDEARAHRDELGAEEELEVERGLRPRAQHLSVHAHDASALPHVSAVEYGLVVAAHCGGGVEHQHVAAEAPRGPWLGTLAEQDHALTQPHRTHVLLSLERAHEEGTRLAGEELLAAGAHAVDALDQHGLEGARVIRTQLQCLPHRHHTGDERARHHSADAGHVEELVDQELHRPVRALRPTLARGHEVDEGLQQVHVLPCYVGDGEDRSHEPVSEGPRGDHHVIHASHLVRPLPRPRYAQQAVELLHRLLQNVLRGEVHLGHDDEYGHVQRNRHAEVLLRHTRHPMVGAHHHHPVVWVVSRHAEHCGLEILLVPGEVDEGDNLGGAGDHLLPVHRAHPSTRRARGCDRLGGGRRAEERGAARATAAATAEGVRAGRVLRVDDAALLVEADVLVLCDGARPARLRLVSVLEHAQPRRAAPVVQAAADENAHER